MAELTEAKVQEMLQQSERALSRKMEDLEALLVKGAKSDKYQTDTLDLLLGRQDALQNILTEMPQGIRTLLSTSISKIIQDEVAKALAVQIPKIIQAVQQQSGGLNPTEKPKQSEQSSPSTPHNTSEKPAGERYADDEKVEKPMPKGFNNRLQAMAQAVKSGAITKEEIFRTKAGEMGIGRNSFVRAERHGNGTEIMEAVDKKGSVAGYRLEEGTKMVKNAVYQNGKATYVVVGHRANIIDKLDETCSTLEEKKEAVRAYRREHPKSGGR